MQQASDTCHRGSTGYNAIIHIPQIKPGYEVGHGFARPPKGGANCQLPGIEASVVVTTKDEKLKSIIRTPPTCCSIVMHYAFDPISPVWLKTTNSAGWQPSFRPPNVPSCPCSLLVPYQ